MHYQALQMYIQKINLVYKSRNPGFCATAEKYIKNNIFYKTSTSKIIPCRQYYYKIHLFR